MMRGELVDQSILDGGGSLRAAADQPDGQSAASRKILTSAMFLVGEGDDDLAGPRRSSGRGHGWWSRSLPTASATSAREAG